MPGARGSACPDRNLASSKRRRTTNHWKKSERRPSLASRCSYHRVRPEQRPHLIVPHSAVACSAAGADFKKHALQRNLQSTERIGERSDHHKIHFRRTSVTNRLHRAVPLPGRRRMMVMSAAINTTSPTRVPRLHCIPLRSKNPYCESSAFWSAFAMPRPE